MPPVVLEMKGTAVQTQVEFVKKTFGEERFKEWCAALPPEARELVEGTILTSSWYKGEPFVVGIRKAICDVFYEGDARGARELGRFSADKGLRGVYKVFVRFGSPNWVAERATQVFSRYFRPGEIETVANDKKSARARLTGFPEKTGLVEQTVAGFMEGAVIISGAKNPAVQIPKSVSKGDQYTEFLVTWD